MATVPIIIAEDMFGDEQEGDLTAWTRQDGEQVTLGATVAEVSTSKAIVEVEAPADGVLRHQCRSGELIRPGQTIGVIERGA
jgi:pyruvate/2-oxoglutarate dehydrogenase complex dihydrolipoamide acyltransferase (E2) component